MKFSVILSVLLIQISAAFAQPQEPTVFNGDSDLSSTQEVHCKIVKFDPSMDGDEILPFLKDSKLKKIVSLDLSQIYCFPALDLVPALMNFNSLSELDLSHRGLDSSNIGEYRPVLSSHSSIQVLKLQYNDLHREGVEFVAQCLKSNCTLKEIDLSGNLLEDDSQAIQAIAEMLKTNQTLRKLTFQSNCIAAADVFCLSDAAISARDRESAEKREIDLSRNEYCGNDQTLIAKRGILVMKPAIEALKVINPHLVLVFEAIDEEAPTP